MKKIWLRNCIAGISLTSLMFTFQACYGTGYDDYNDVFIQGKVVSETTGLPIEGIRVSIDSTGQYTFTDSSGSYSLWTEKAFKARMLFEDIDSTLHQYYKDKDTMLSKLQEDIELNIALEDK